MDDKLCDSFGVHISTFPNIREWICLNLLLNLKLDFKAVNCGLSVQRPGNISFSGNFHETLVKNNNTIVHFDKWIPKWAEIHFC